MAREISEGRAVTIDGKELSEASLLGLLLGRPEGFPHDFNATKQFVSTVFDNLTGFVD